MGRLIDADALKDKVLKWLPSDPCGVEEKEMPYETDIVVSLMMEIEDAPTIDAVSEWIPCSERVPEISGAYLVWVKWPYEEYPSWSIINYDADCEAFGEWHEYYHPDTLGYLDSEFVEIKDVYAWMPLPKPYGERGE